MTRTNFNAAFVALALAGAAMCLVAGCSRGEVLGEVTGRVTFQGQPVSDVIVIFRNQTKGVFMTTRADENGEFRVNMAKGYGLPLGTYEVLLSPPVQDAPVGPALAPPEFADLSKMPQRYREAETSGITLEVKEGENPLMIDMVP